MEGTAYKATALEFLSKSGRYPSSSPYSRGDVPSCAARDGFQPGSMVQLRATEWIRGPHCYYPFARIESIPGIEPVSTDEVIQFFSPVDDAVPFYVGAGRIQAGGCLMNVVFGLTRGIDVTTSLLSADIFGEPRAGEMPPAVIYRALWPAAQETDCELCEDLFAATVKAEN